MILFLDFDGVLHPETGQVPFENTHLLWQILRKAPDVRVVFSTSWRECYSFDELVNFATFGGGESLSHLFVGVTPVVPVAQGADDYRRRELECLDWMERHRAAGNWLALDDCAYWFSLGSPNLHLVDYVTGLTEADVASVITKIEAAR